MNKVLLFERIYIVWLRIERIFDDKFSCKILAVFGWISAFTTHVGITAVCVEENTSVPSYIYSEGTVFIHRTENPVIE